MLFAYKRICVRLLKFRRSSLVTRYWSALHINTAAAAVSHKFLIYDAINVRVVCVYVYGYRAYVSHIKHHRQRCHCARQLCARFLTYPLIVIFHNSHMCGGTHRKFVYFIVLVCVGTAGYGNFRI